jgi:hypothetical protein
MFTITIGQGKGEVENNYLKMIVIVRRSLNNRINIIIHITYDNQTKNSINILY